MKAAIPHCEVQRLEKLYEYQILDTLPDESFDRVTRLLAGILDVPVALVSLVDRDRQWFKSRYGLEAEETPREVSFCAHAILGQELFIVENAKQDERFCENPLVTGGPEIRFYAGAPLTTDDGLNVGTLCAIDSRPRTLTDKQKEMLRDLASVIIDEMELVRARQIAEQSEKAKSDFLAAMSHEIRTPLSAILGFAQLLQMSRPESAPEGMTDYLEYILKGGEHLLSLINDVLDLARIDAGRLSVSIEEIVLGPILDECSFYVQGAAEKRGIVLQFTDDLADMRLVGDYKRVKQVMINLLSNAVKYNRDNGDVLVSASMVENGYVRIQVRDTGFGIPEDRLESIFQPFNRLERDSRTVEGTGIGLTITRKLVIQMNGRMGVDSREGEGSTFWIELPFVEKVIEAKEKPAAIAVEEERPEAVEGPLPVLLYIEDNPTNMMLMREIMSAHGSMRLLEAHSAEIGIDLARTARPDIILLDVNLPGMSGIEAVRKLRVLEETQDIPVIGLSADVMPETVMAGLEAGFAAYLTKPINIPRTLATLDEHLKARAGESTETKELAG